MDKDFAKNIKNTVCDLAKKTAKVSGELLDTAKIKLEIFELKSEIKKLYNEIGKLTYLSITAQKDNAESVKMKCEIIKAKYKKIEALLEMSSTLQFRCPVCDKPVDCGEDYCPSCGADMTVDVEGEVNDNQENDGAQK